MGVLDGLIDFGKTFGKEVIKQTQKLQADELARKYEVEFEVESDEALKSIYKHLGDDTDGLARKQAIKRILNRRMGIDD